MKYLNDLKKIFQILTSTERHQMKYLFIFMIFGMIIETFGIAIVVPFISLLVQGDYREKFPGVIPWLEKMGNPDHNTLIIIALLLLVIVYVVKNFFLIYLSWQQTSFISKAMANLSNRLFDLYLHQPYTFHLQHNSAQLIRNIIGEVNTFGSSVLIVALLFVSELFVLLGILTLLLYMEPMGTIIIISIMVIIGGLFHLLTKNMILKWGKMRQYHEGMRLKHIQEGLGGIKMVQLSATESTFINNYKFHADEVAYANQRQQFLTQLPRYIFEIVAISGLSILILFLIYKEGSTENILPMLGLFAMAAFRLMPSVNRIIISAQHLKYGTPVIDLIYNEIKSFPKVTKMNSEDDLHFVQSLELKDISFIYPEAKKKSLNDISLIIPKGKTVGFVGESGSGKSTTADIILGLLKPTTGEVLVDEVNIQYNIASWQRKIGYVPQSIYLTDGTLRQNIAFGLDNEEIDDKRVWEVLKIAQLDKFIKESAQGLDVVIGEHGVRLSGGQQQRIGIARALYHDPEVLLLDEATSALDNKTEANFMKMIMKLQGKKTIIIIAHRLTTVESCDYIYEFKDGELVNSSRPEIYLEN